MTEMTQYVHDYDLPRLQHAITVSCFLEGKAYDFYVSSVSKHPGHWTLKDLFLELFNACFPLDFCMRQRAQFNRCRQGDWSVRDFVYDLETLANTAGIWSE